jgi:hypothetical protein
LDLQFTSFNIETSTVHPANATPKYCQRDQQFGYERTSILIEGMEKFAPGLSGPWNQAPKLFMKPKHSSLSSLLKELYRYDEFNY